jgi:putative FmdB family regulatory protein
VPKYVFECQACNLRFERILKMGDHALHPCPECKDDAPGVITNISGFAFAPGGTATANSGVHDQDYPTADKAVGRSAEVRWEMMGRRNEVKEEARKQGQTHALIRHTGAGYIDYEPMSDVGLNAHRKLAKTAIATVRANNEAKKEAAKARPR